VIRLTSLEELKIDCYPEWEKSAAVKLSIILWLKNYSQCPICGNMNNEKKTFSINKLS
jgi:hypothetical protein